MTSKPPLSNVELVTDLMTYGGPHGSLTQVFIVDAILKGARRIADASIDTVASAMEGHMIDDKAWHATAAYIKRRLEENYQ